MPTITVRRNTQAKAALKAYRSRPRTAATGAVDPYVDKVDMAITLLGRLHPRDDSDSERRLSVAFTTFPETIRRSAAELRSPLSRRPNRPGMLRVGRTLGRLVDEGVTKAKAESTAPPSACRRGCHFCCHLPVETTVPQVLVIADHLSRNFGPLEMHELRERIDGYEARVASHPSGKGLGLCPLNVDGACSVYEVRPTICRSYNSTDAGACERSFAKGWQAPIPIDYGPLGAEIAVQAGYSIAGLIQGRPYLSVSLVPALRTALDHPEAYRAEDFDVQDPFVEMADFGGLHS